MATFQVPQFIEQRAKIIGPFTIEQFLYIAAAGILSFLAFYLFNFFLWLVVTVFFGGIALAFAFVKINGENLPQILRSAFNYYLRPRTYTWQRTVAETILDVAEVEKLQALRNKMSFQEKLKSIALNVTTGKIFSPKKFRDEQKERFQVVTYLTGEKEVAKKIDY